MLGTVLEICQFEMLIMLMDWRSSGDEKTVACVERAWRRAGCRVDKEGARVLDVDVWGDRRDTHPELNRWMQMDDGQSDKSGESDG